MSLAVFFSAFQGGISGGTLQLMTPNRMRGQVMAVYLLVANLIGLGLGPTVLAATTDYVFGADEAIGQAIALVRRGVVSAGSVDFVAGRTGDPAGNRGAGGNRNPETARSARRGLRTADADRDQGIDGDEQEIGDADQADDERRIAPTLASNQPEYGIGYAGKGRSDRGK